MKTIFLYFIAIFLLGCSYNTYVYNYPSHSDTVYVVKECEFKPSGLTPGTEILIIDNTPYKIKHPYSYGELILSGYQLHPFPTNDTTLNLRLIK